MRYSMVLALTGLLSCAAPAWSDEDTAGGAATPKESVAKLQAALDLQDAAAVKGAIDTLGAAPERAELMAKFLLAGHVFASHRKTAATKLGEAMGEHVARAGGALGQSKLDLAKLRELGRIRTDAKGQAELVYAEDATIEGVRHVSTSSIPVVQRGARWYIDPRLPEDPARAKEALAMIAAVSEAAQALNDTLAGLLGAERIDADGFSAAVTAAGNTFEKSIALRLAQEKPVGSTEDAGSGS